MYHLIKNPFERKQKGAVSALCVMFIVLMVSLSSCVQKAVVEESDEGVKVPYVPCTCEENPLAELQFSQLEAYLLKDSIPKQIDFEIRSELYESSKEVCWIVFDSKTNNAILTVGGGAIRNICEICNFPDFVKEWNIPQNGCKIYFEGLTYQPCAPKGGIATESYFDYVLTTIKKK